MSRPSSGYKLADGTKVIGVTTVLNRFKESGGLIGWAHKMGAAGIPLSEAREKAMDAGSCGHQMIDDHLHGRTFDRAAWKPEILAAADHAMLGFLEWADTNKFKLAESEVSFVSERHRFGGTFDAALTGGTKLVLFDFKVASGVYSDHLVQVAGGYSLLWQENRSVQIDAVAILRLTKPENESDPVSFHHHQWSAEIIPTAQRYFLLLREAYDLDKRLTKMV